MAGSVRRIMTDAASRTVNPVHSVSLVDALGPDKTLLSASGRLWELFSRVKTNVQRRLHVERSVFLTEQMKSGVAELCE